MSHAKAGCADELHGYIGRGGELAEAMQAFALAYRRRNEADFNALRKAASAGRVPADAGLGE